MKNLLTDQSELQSTTSPYTWPLLDVAALLSDGVLNEQDLITQIQSLKRTTAHAVVIEARDNVFKVFFGFFFLFIRFAFQQKILFEEYT